MIGLDVKCIYESHLHAVTGVKQHVTLYDTCADCCSTENYYCTDQNDLQTKNGSS